MAINPYMSQKVRSEQSLYEDLIIEAIQMYGQDVYYLPREIVNQDKILLDDVPSHFSDAYKVEVYIENTDGFAGEGDLFTKFGIELRDQATFVVARRRWNQLIGDKLEANKFRPREGDIIFLPLSESMFQIMSVDTENPFYQLNQLPLYRMQCELFEYSDEDFDTGIDMIDVVEEEHAFQYHLQMADPESLDAELTCDINTQGEVTNVTVIEGGSGYTTNPTVTVQPPTSGFAKFGDYSLDTSIGRGDSGLFDVTSPHGSIEFFINISQYPQAGDKAIMFISGGNTTDEVSKRLAFGYNETGGLLLQIFEGADVVELDGQLPLGEWAHIAFYSEDQLFKVFIDGEMVDELSFSESQNFLSDEGFLLGGHASGNVQGTDWVNPVAHIDEFRAQAGIFSQILDPYLDVNTLDVPVEEFTADAYTAYLGHYDGRSAVIELTVEEGVVTDATIIDGGNLYDSSPELEVSNPGVEGFYATGEEVYQQFDDYQMKGEVTNWNSETRMLDIAHSGATDGKFHTWVEGKYVYGENAAFLLESVDEGENEIQPFSQNQTFEDFAQDFIDFDEKNPFGEIL